MQIFLPRLLLVVATLISIFLLPSLPLVESLDTSLLTWAKTHRSPGLSVFFLFITHLGSTLGLVIALLGGFLYYGLQRRWQTAWFFLLGLGLWKLSVPLLKWLVGRPRPADGLLELTTLSMPSGHGANAVLIYGVWGILLAKRFAKPLPQILMMVAAFVMIMLTDYSRMYLGVHYFSDVLMGSLWAAVGVYLLQGVKQDLLS